MAESEKVVIDSSSTWLNAGSSSCLKTERFSERINPKKVTSQSLLSSGTRKNSSVSSRLTSLGSGWMTGDHNSARMTISPEGTEISSVKRRCSRCCQLWALYQKDLIVCRWRRHFVLSTFELVWLLLVMLSIAALHGYRSQRREDSHRFLELPPFETIDFIAASESSFEGNNSQIAYVPLTKYTTEVVEDAFKNVTPAARFHSFVSISEWEHFLDRSNGTTIHLGIVFDQNTAKGVHITDLSYILRFNETLYEFHIDEIFPSPTVARYNRTTRQETLLLWPCMNAIFTSHLTFYGFQPSDGEPPRIHFFPTSSYERGLERGTRRYISSTIVIGCLVFLMFFTGRIIRDKQNRTKEFRRLMGISDFVYCTNLFFVGLTTMTMLMMITTVALCYPIFNHGLYEKSNAVLIFLVLLVFSASSVTQMVLTAVLFNNVIIGVLTSMVLWLLSAGPGLHLDPSNEREYFHLSAVGKLVSSFLPATGLLWACKILSLWEESGIGAQWNCITTPYRSDNITLIHIVLVMSASAVLFTLLTLYFIAVLPCRQGISRHPFFLCQPTYWWPRIEAKRPSQAASPSSEGSQISSSVFEPEPADMETPVIELRRVSHRFAKGAKPLLDDISLKLYRNRVTIVYGYKGSGKTTLMNILTGLLVPTTGAVSIYGHNVVEKLSEARGLLGVCPEQNVIFDELTVDENLKFFARIKGTPTGEITAEVDKILMKFDLYSRRRTKCQKLVASLKRKLCIATAMVGGSTVLLLDEPTAGMDSETRRSVWTILQEARHGRAILLTTHNMEEAELLADKIALLVHGKLKCHGSPMFLKKSFQTGYLLRCVKTSVDVDITTIVRRIRRHLHLAPVYLASDVGYQCNINIGLPTISDLIKLFRDLEKNKAELSIASLGLSVTTIEDVFLKIGELDHDRKTVTDTRTVRSDEHILKFTKESGFALAFGQFRALFMKRVRIFRRQWFAVLFMLFVSCLLVGMFVYWAQTIIAIAENNEPPLLNYMFEALVGTEQLHGFIRNTSQTLPVEEDEDEYMRLAMELAHVRVHELDAKIDVDDYLLGIAHRHPEAFRMQWVMGVTRNLSSSHDSVLWFNADRYHIGAAALAIWQTALIHQLDELFNKSAPKKWKPVNVTNQPLITDTWTNGNPLLAVVRVSAAMLLPLATSCLVCSMIYLPIQERVSKAKLVQRMSGVHGAVFFSASFLFDFLIVAACAFFIMLVMTLASLSDSREVLFDSSAAIWFVLCEYGIAMIFILNLAAYLFKSPTAGFFAALGVTSLLGGILTIGVSMHTIIGGTFAIQLASYVPMFSVVWALTNIYLNAHSKQFCGAFSDRGLNTFCNSRFAFDVCCFPCPSWNSSRIFCYKYFSSFRADPHLGAGYQMATLALIALLSLIVFVLIEEYPHCWHQSSTCFRSKNLPHTPAKDTTNEDEVCVERRKVDDLIAAGRQAEYAVLAHQLTKNYGSFKAVDQISFALRPGECFGLLGGHGAGKSTTIAMMTGETAITEGNVFIGDSDIRSSLRQYRSHVGYCPQSDFLIDKLSGIEILQLFCGLRGVPADQMDAVINQTVTFSGLHGLSEKPVNKYNPVMKRKLCFALAIVGNPRVVFLDDPTAGLDRIARLKIWCTLEKLQKELNTSVVLASRSMTECETLCARMAIMVNGSLRCLGSSQYLKAKFAQGFTVVIKLRTLDDPEIVPKVCATMDRLFPDTNRLQDCYQRLLYVHIWDSQLSWTELFEKAEVLNEEFEFDSLFVSDTSLEQIFLLLAKTQRTDQNDSPPETVPRIVHRL